MARTDLDAHIPDFIAMAESTLNNNGDFRIRKMVCKLKAELTGDEFGLPPDYLGMRILRTGSGVEICQVSPQGLQNIKERGCDGQIYYLELGQRLEIYPPADDLSVDLFYYQKIPPLSEDNETNWLLEQSPNTYLFGALLEATQYLKDDSRIQIWMQRYAGSVDSMVAADKQDRWSGLQQVRVSA